MIDEQRTLEIYGYTSDEMGKWAVKPIVCICDDCGKYRVILKCNYRTLCGSCKRKGVKFTEKTKSNMSKSAIKRFKNEKHPMQGRQFTKEHIKNLSDSHKGVKQSVETIEKRIIRGKKHYNWQGGITPDTRKRTKGILWKGIADNIRKRDRNMCCVCGAKGVIKKLPVHHIIPYRVCKSHDPNNLITVCQSCHIKLDREYNNNHPQQRSGV